MRPAVPAMPARTPRPERMVRRLQHAFWVVLWPSPGSIRLVWLAGGLGVPAGGRLSCVLL
jgi:hypothetical protein